MNATSAVAAVVIGLLLAGGPMVRAAPPVDPPGTVAPAAEAAYQAAVALRRAGRFGEAAAAFEAIAPQHPRSRRAAQALVAAASIRWTQLDDERAARRLLRRALEGPADVPGVEQAMRQLAYLERRSGGPERELAFLNRLYQRRRQTELGPLLLERAAHILDADLSRPSEALALLEQLRDHHAGSTLRDDAALAEADLLRRLHRPEDALRPVRRVIASHQESFIVGEYDSSLLDDAYLLHAEILERDLGRLEASESQYLQLVRELPESILVDDALARAAATAIRRGDPAAAARHRAELARLRPGSRFLHRPSSSRARP
ncbi:MAG: hypothetical protein IT384_21395 [Deltaproteobacteria bacterium]|nr:hypothetical protein [Deltaproteobacteria bacterium]